MDGWRGGAGEQCTGGDTSSRFKSFCFENAAQMFDGIPRNKRRDHGGSGIHLKGPETRRLGNSCRGYVLAQEKEQIPAKMNPRAGRFDRLLRLRLLMDA